MQPSTNTAMSVLTLIQINPISCCFLETQFKLNYFKERTCDMEKQFYYSSINLFSPLSQEFCNQLLSDKKKQKKMSDMFTWSAFNSGDYNMQEKTKLFSLSTEGLCSKTKGQ